MSSNNNEQKETYPIILPWKGLNNDIDIDTKELFIVGPFDESYPNIEELKENITKKLKFKYLYEIFHEKQENLYVKIFLNTWKFTTPEINIIKLYFETFKEEKENNSKCDILEKIVEYFNKETNDNKEYSNENYLLTQIMEHINDNINNISQEDRHVKLLYYFKKYKFNFCYEIINDLFVNRFFSIFNKFTDYVEKQVLVKVKSKKSVIKFNISESNNVKYSNKNKTSTYNLFKNINNDADLTKLFIKYSHNSTEETKNEIINKLKSQYSIKEINILLNFVDNNQYIFEEILNNFNQYKDDFNKLSYRSKYELRNNNIESPTINDEKVKIPHMSVSKSKTKVYKIIEYNNKNYTSNNNNNNIEKDIKTTLYNIIFKFFNKSKNIKFKFYPENARNDNNDDSSYINFDAAKTDITDDDLRNYLMSKKEYKNNKLNLIDYLSFIILFTMNTHNYFININDDEDDDDDYQYNIYNYDKDFKRYNTAYIKLFTNIFKHFIDKISNIYRLIYITYNKNNKENYNIYNIDRQFDKIKKNIEEEIKKIVESNIQENKENKKIFDKNNSIIKGYTDIIFKNIFDINFENKPIDYEKQIKKLTENTGDFIFIQKILEIDNDKYQNKIKYLNKIIKKFFTTSLEEYKFNTANITDKDYEGIKEFINTNTENFNVMKQLIYTLKDFIKYIEQLIKKIKNKITIELVETKPNTYITDNLIGGVNKININSDNEFKTRIADNEKINKKIYNNGFIYNKKYYIYNETKHTNVDNVYIALFKLFFNENNIDNIKDLKDKLNTINNNLQNSNKKQSGGDPNTTNNEDKVNKFIDDINESIEELKELDDGSKIFEKLKEYIKKSDKTDNTIDNDKVTQIYNLINYYDNEKKDILKTEIQFLKDKFKKKLINKFRKIQNINNTDFDTDFDIYFKNLDEIIQGNNDILAYRLKYEHFIIIKNIFEEIKNKLEIN